MKNKLNFFIIIFLFSFVSNMSLAKDNKNRIAVGGGIYNFMNEVNI